MHEWSLQSQKDFSNRILTVQKKNFQFRKASLEVRKLSFLLHCTAVRNEKRLPAKVFSWIDFVLFFVFSSNYYLVCLQFILSFRRWTYIGMEQKKQSLEFWNHSERVDGNLPAEVNYKPRVMFAWPYLSRDTMRGHKEFRRTCTDSRFDIMTLIINFDLKECTKVGSSWLKRLTYHII